MDGRFDETWKCVRSARGRYTRLYIDFVRDDDAPGGAGGYLVMLNDWLVNDQGDVPSHCYNRFSVTTGGGSERWRPVKIAKSTFVHCTHGTAQLL